MELPPPSDPDPAGAAAVQELMGGRFGEMSTFMNYTFQSWNFRGRQGARPFYDLVANIAAEEFGHVELVATAINTMLTGATPESNGRARTELATKSPLVDVKGLGNPHHFLAGGQGALPQNSQGRPWTGDYVFASGDLVEDLTHNFFLETGARNNKLKVYEMVEHPAARALTGYLLVRGGVHQVADARALEPHGREPDEDVSDAANRDGEDPGVPAAHRARRSPPALPLLARRLPGAPAVFNGPHPETEEELVVFDEAPEAFLLAIFLLSRRCFAPGYAPEEIAEIAQKLRERAGLPKEPTGLVADLEEQAKRSTKKASSRAKARA